MTKLGQGALFLFYYLDVVAVLAIGDWISGVGPLLLYGSPAAFVTGFVTRRYMTSIGEMRRATRFCRSPVGQRNLKLCWTYAASSRAALPGSLTSMANDPASMSPDIFVWAAGGSRLERRRERQVLCGGQARLAGLRPAGPR
ncbi:hypothetical protein [Streptomyces sp. CA-251251]|uniref:hypothetical protein n=1 Tax=Streptomyces sp. CA-251251 TaxID=3240063 RepID=UPI003D8CCABA